MEFKELVKKAKLRLLRMHYESGVGHIGGNLSALDAMLFLHLEVMKEGDVFVLSKGHSVGALYVTLWIQGKLSDKELTTFHGEGTKLAGHPVAGWSPCIRFSTGSLGHGLGLASGLALAKKFKQEKGQIYCLLSDGEWQEGSNWETLIFIAHHRLCNVTLLIDGNGLQGFGNTTEVASMGFLADKMKVFGVDVYEIDGHCPKALNAALKATPISPNVVVLHTIKGHGVSFMENLMEWHYLPLTRSQYLQAIEEVSIS